MGSVRGQVAQAFRVECEGIVTKMMKATGPLKLQTKPRSFFSQHLGEKGGIWSGARGESGGSGALCVVQLHVPGWPLSLFWPNHSALTSSLGHSHRDRLLLRWPR